LSFKQTRKRVKEILDKYGVQTIELPPEDSKLVVPNYDFNLSYVMDLDGEDVLAMKNWDDCNLYQEEGFYIESLEKIDAQQKNSISIKNIKEDWGSDGNIKLSFSLNGDSQVLEFNHLEEHDNVPLVFVDYVRKLLLNYEGDSKFILVDDEQADFYCLVPILALKEIQQSMGLSARDIGWHRAEYVLEDEPEDDHPIKKGSNVRHSQFGDGVVIQKEGEGASLRVQVDFSNEGMKWLLLQYASLELI